MSMACFLFSTLMFIVMVDVVVTVVAAMVLIVVLIFVVIIVRVEFVYGVNGFRCGVQ